MGRGGGGGGGGGGRQARGQNFGGGQALGGSAAGPGVSARDAAAQAAMARHSQNSSSGGGGQLTETDARLKERRQKDELIGKIEAMYAAQNRDPPIGLAASSLDALRRHLEHMQRALP